MNHDLVAPIDSGDSKWKRFEKLIAQIHARLAPKGANVTWNDHIVGRKSQQSRQIDVSIRTKIAATEVLIIVQCRDYNHPVDVNDVGEFVSVIDDVGAAKGIMAASLHGFTEAAQKLAEANNVDLIALVDAQGTMWKEYFGDSPPTHKQVGEIRTLVTNNRLAVSFTILDKDLEERFAIPFEFARAPLVHAESGLPAGTPVDLVGVLWGKGAIEWEPGIRHYIVDLKSPVAFPVDPARSRITRFRFSATVTQQHYYGIWEVEELQGIYNYRNDSVTTQGALKTKHLDLADVAANWQQVASPQDVPKPVGLIVPIADKWSTSAGVTLPEILDSRQVEDEQELREN